MYKQTEFRVPMLNLMENFLTRLFHRLEKCLIFRITNRREISRERGIEAIEMVTVACGESDIKRAIV